MTKHMEGVVLFARFKDVLTFTWTDPETGTPKPITSYDVRLSHDDGTISKERISFPKDYQAPSDLVKGAFYGFPVTPSVNKKNQLLRWQARSDLMPFPAPELS